MPRESEQRPCTFRNCGGTQTFSNESRPPGWSSGTGDDEGNVHYAVNEQPGWQCDLDHEHWDAPLELTIEPVEWVDAATQREVSAYAIKGLPDNGQARIYRRDGGIWEATILDGDTFRSLGFYDSPEAAGAGVARR